MSDTSYLMTSESVGEGHPDKMADQISDAILDAIISQDKNCRVAVETLVKTGLVVLAGEITTSEEVDYEAIARKTIERIGYNHSNLGFDHLSCKIISAISKQSPDIAMGVDREDKEKQGAGDQGLMFGYAVNETKALMPATIQISHDLVKRHSEVRKNRTIEWLRPDAKSQVTINFTNGKPDHIDTVVLSTQHDDNVDMEEIHQSVLEHIIMPILPDELVTKETHYLINPTGSFVIGGPVGDCGLTGRKIIVDTYGGKGAHGGGAFSGKDPSKVDRSAAYAARHIAKNLVAAGVAEEILIQLSYAIGIAQPIGVYVNTYNSSKIAFNDFEIAKKIKKIFDLRPAIIEKRLQLRNPIYELTAAYGHMGRTSQVIQKNDLKFESFTWEKLDYLNPIKKEFNL